MKTVMISKMKGKKRSTAVIIKHPSAEFHYHFPGSIKQQIVKGLTKGLF